MQVPLIQRPVSAADLPPEQLAHNSALSEPEKLAQASRQFEALLLRQILAETQKTVIPSKFSDNSVSSGIYRDMVTNQLADSISKSGGFGLAGTFQRQLTHQAAAGHPAGASPSPKTLHSHPPVVPAKPSPTPCKPAPVLQ